jgi:hypothetical protein
LGLLGIAALPILIAPVLESKLQAGLLPKIPLAALVAASLVQPTLLLAGGVAAGAAFGARLGICSHIASVNVRRAYSTELPLSLGSGMMVGLVVLSADRWIFESQQAESVAAAQSLHIGNLGSLFAGLLYGGLTEELMMRWGLVSLLAWGAYRVFQRGAGQPSSRIFVVSIVVAALLFGAGHLPAAAAIAPLTAPLIARVVVLNGLAGTVFGWLFWRRSLESAMLAHATTHVILALARAVQ